MEDLQLQVMDFYLVVLVLVQHLLELPVAPDCSQAPVVYVETDGSMCSVLWIPFHVQVCRRELKHHSPDL